MKLRINTNMEKLPAEIDFNFEELKAEMAASVEKYNSLVVTEESIQAAKKDRANLNKLRTAIEDRRKSLKNEWMAPYNAFEKKVRELTGIIDKPIGLIDGQVKRFDDMRREERQRELDAIYDANIGDLREILPLDRLQDKRWLNATFKVKDAEDHIKTMVSRVENNIRAIDTMNLPCKDTMLSAYIRTLDMSDAMEEKHRWEKEQEALKVLRSERERQIKAPEKAQEMENEQEVIDRPAVSAQDAEDAVTQIDFRVWATREQLKGLKQYLLRNSIKYGRVE